ncbi:MAG: hypothetical protein KatS3mg099_190 [Candidatus Parcubacteria bacterium]|nr:MAG: hypothetical protein KatS3mg099_190 [Candidatus Parcubacteria bacterium]
MRGVTWTPEGYRVAYAFPSYSISIRGPQDNLNPLELPDVIYGELWVIPESSFNPIATGAIMDNGAVDKKAFKQALRNCRECTGQGVEFARSEYYNGVWSAPAVTMERVVSRENLKRTTTTSSLILTMTSRSSTRAIKSSTSTAVKNTS